ncbi:hypothetical protein ACFLU6_11345 [Acidobacteriota bacterium]
MKRFLCLLALAAFLLAIPAANMVTAKNQRVLICHFDVDDTGNGYLIAISEKGQAVRQHRRHHRDCFKNDVIITGPHTCDCAVRP